MGLCQTNSCIVFAQFKKQCHICGDISIPGSSSSRVDSGFLSHYYVSTDALDQIGKWDVIYTLYIICTRIKITTLDGSFMVLLGYVAMTLSVTLLLNTNNESVTKLKTDFYNQNYF